MNTIVKPSRKSNESCKWGNENEHNALVKYNEHMEKRGIHIELCYSCGLVINPKWPWLGASPDSLAKDSNEKNSCGAVEIKCPASKADLTILEACVDKSFCLEIKDQIPKLKKKNIVTIFNVKVLWQFVS